MEIKAPNNIIKNNSFSVFLAGTIDNGNSIDWQKNISNILQKDGITVVLKDEKGDYILKDRATWEDVNSKQNQLKTIFKDGVFYNETTLTDIRNRIQKTLI